MKKTSTNRILAALLAVALVLVILPAPVSAQTTLCPCCNKPISQITWTALPATATNLTAGHYRAEADMTLTGEHTVKTASGVTVVDLNGKTLTAAPNNRAFSISGSTLSIADFAGGGTVLGNGPVTSSGGLIKTTSKGVFNLYGGTISGGSVDGDGVTGGNIRISGTFNMYGGTVTGGRSVDNGGNIHIGSNSAANIYGGLIEKGNASSCPEYSGRGGNIYLTTNGKLTIYGGTIAEGNCAEGPGGNIYAYSNAEVTIYGGTIKDGTAKSKGNNIYVSYSGSNFASLFIYGGAVIGGSNSITRAGSDCTIRIYNGDFVGENPVADLADCACVYADGDTYRVWNYGYYDETCLDCDFVKAVENRLVTPREGRHHYTYQSTGTCVCTGCGHRFISAAAVAIGDGVIYTDLNEATAATTICLVNNAATEELLLNGVTLDLNGYTLTAKSLSATGGKIIDSTNGQGCLLAQSVALAENNPALAVEDGGLRFSTMTPDVTLERLSRDKVRIRFLFTEKAADTILDDLILAGNRDISVRLRLTWKNSQGQTKEKTYICDPSLLVKYAQKWDGRRYVVTISGVDAVQDLTCTVEVATDSVTVAATKLKNVNYINEKLSWEAINSFPMKTETMTVAQMRDLCVDFFHYSKTFLWTPDQTVNYIRNSSGAKDSMSQGTVYGGMPYVGNASGSPYRMMDYVNQESGLVDMQKALPNLNGDARLAMTDLVYFGSQCAKTATLGWGRVINSADYRRTGNMLPYHGFIMLGDVYVDPTITSWTASYNTDMACAENGEEVVYGGYAQLQKADGLVYYVETASGSGAGHVIMAYEDAHVVYNKDGSINGQESYLIYIDQAQSWKDGTNSSGDSYKYKSSIAAKKTFAELFNGGYLPFTFAEFVSGNPIEETTLQLTVGQTTLISGTIRESDRVFVADTTAQMLTFSQLCSATATSNYGISDVYIVIYNQRGQELYRHAVRSSSSGVPTLKLAAQGDQVTTWQYGELVSGKTYSAKVEVQLYTGERPTIFSGQLTMDN